MTADALPARAAQRVAADPARSVWVAASAGTGKTKVLTDRVLRLLLAGTPPERILCLTFTRAAAAEMALRIDRQLGAWTVADDEILADQIAVLTAAPPDAATLARARRLFAAVLDAPGGLKLMTIHAFCQSLLARFPLEAGVVPHFQVMDERTTAEFLRAAQDAVLSRARASGDEALAAALAEVAAHSSEASFADLMSALRAARGRLRAAIRDHGGLDALIAAVFKLLAVAEDETPATARAAAVAENAFDRAALQAAAAALAAGSDAEGKRATRLAAWLAAPADERAETFADYQALFLTQAGDPRAKLMTKPTATAAPDARDALEAEQARMMEVREHLNAVVVARATAALLRLGGAMLDAYDRHKEARARLDYDDLILTAAALLGERAVAPWVLYKLDGGLDHILVDEAQDTNPAQWRVIAALAEEFFAGEGAREGGRTVFVVGDEKQSIFSFQGADLDALDRMRSDFARRAGSDRWEEVGLDLSFRSTAAVLAAVDAVFAGAGARDGVAFADHKISHRAARRGHAGLVELWPLVEAADAAERAPWEPPLERRASDRPVTRLANRIARMIRGWIDDGERLPARDRAIRPGDVLILVRRRGALVEALARALKAAGVRVAGADRMVLTDQLAVMDLAALGRFLLLPDDDLTLATVLKGPLIGLDEEALFDLAYQRPNSLWRALAARRGERADFARAHERLAALLARADFTPPFELYAELLGAGGGRAAIVARLGPDANDPIDEFLALALDYERAEPASLQGFLHWLDAAEVTLKRDMEQGRDAVRVMTVHGAKGLQAPIVILPDTIGLPPSPSAGLLWPETTAEGAPETPLWPVRADFDVDPCRRAKAAAREDAMREYRRLLYVAMTRAEDRLYVCGADGRGAADPACWYRLVEAGLAEAAEPFAFDCADAPGGWAGEGRRRVDRQARAPEPDAAIIETAARAAAPPAFARAPAPPEPTPPRPLAPSAPVVAEPPVLTPAGDGARRFARGRLIHRLLELLPEIEPAERGAAATGYLARQGLDAAAAQAIADEVLAVIDEPRFAAVFGPGSRAEVPLVGVIGGVVVAGQIDRLVVTDTRVLIVDFKSNRPPPESAKAVPPAYRQQMAAYRAVVARVYPDRAIDCALLWTDGPRLMALPDALLDDWTG